MQIYNNMINRYVAPCRANTSTYPISGFRLNKDEQFKSNEPTVSVNQLIDYTEHYKTLMSQRTMASLSRWQNKETNQSEENGKIAGEDKKPRKITYYQGMPTETWALTDSKYTDKETGISWHVRDGKYPYMSGEDAENFRKLCSETGEFALKKFAEMTGLIQQLNDNTVAYIGDNGIAIKSRDGQELFVDTSDVSYEALMKMFRNLPKSDNYFDKNYWLNNILTL